MRAAIREEVERVQPLDELERESKLDVLAWIDSGAELCRLEKPATPPKHLISYFAVVDGDHLLLVDHINAGLWLPTGGHVDPGEHPRDTALREAWEELSIEGEFLREGPIFVTITETVGKTAGHTDVSLWYTLRGDRRANLVFDNSEFHDARWFHKNDVPLDRTDKQMSRFLQKLYGEPLACSLPPQMNSELHPAIDEAEALKSAYDRAYERNNRSSVGMQISAEEVPEALEKFAKIAAGEHWTKVGFPAESLAEVMYGTVHDIRTYYEELACELADGPIGPWATEQWFYDQTKAGQTILQARRTMRDNEADESLWFGLATAGRE